MRSFFAFLIAVFVGAATVCPVLALDTTNYGTALNVIYQVDPLVHPYGGKFARLSNPVWSPDGNTIAFTGYTGSDIFTVPSAGGDPTLIYNNLGKKEGYPLAPDSSGIGGGMSTLGFTPDGTEIIFQDDIIDPALGSYAGPYDFPPSSLYPDGYHSDFVVWHPVSIVQSINTATGTVRTLAKEASNATLSPDGRYLAYDWHSYKGMAFTDMNPPHAMKVLDLETGESRILDAEGYNPCFTPDSKYVIYSYTSENSTNSMQSSIILYRIPVTGGTPEQITSARLDQTISGVYNSQVSPDGEWILFFYRTSPQGTTVYKHLCVLNMNTKEAFEIFPGTEKSVEDARWSPDGNKIAYTLKSFDATDAELDGKTGIYIVDFPVSSMSSLQPTAVTEAVPVNFALAGNYPNPFNPSTTISFTLPSSGIANLSIYSITGQKVRDLVSGPLSSGAHSVTWDGRDASGKAVSSGVYLSRLSMGNHTATGRMLLEK